MLPHTYRHCILASWRALGEPSGPVPVNNLDLSIGLEHDQPCGDLVDEQSTVADNHDHAWKVDSRTFHDRRASQVQAVDRLGM